MSEGSSLRDLGPRLVSGRRIELSGRAWAVLAALPVAFVVVIEAIARLHHVRGPIDLLGTDLFGRPGVGELKIAGLLLALLCLPARLRGPVLGAVVVLEIGWNLQRVLVGNPGSLGNGILFGLLGTAVFAGRWLSGRERAAALKAVGLGLLLIVMGRVGDAWLVLSARSGPNVFDEYVELADRALGSPSWVLGSVVTGDRWLSAVLMQIYIFLPVGAVVIAFFQLRHSARDGFPRHHIVRTFLLIGMIGPVVYFLFPVVGPTFAFGNEAVGAGWQDVWPLRLPVIDQPAPTFFDQSVARNCMPSLHTAWAMCIFLHGWRGPTASKVFGSFWLLCTTGATLGFGFHYAIDILAGIVFTLTLEAALTRPELGWSRHRYAVIAVGAVVFGGLLVVTRYLSVELASSGAAGGFVLVTAVVVVAGAFLTIELHPGVREIPVNVATALTGDVEKTGPPAS